MVYIIVYVLAVVATFAFYEAMNGDDPEDEPDPTLSAGAERGAWVDTGKPKILLSLLHLWTSKCAGRRCPTRDDLKVSELKPWLGYLALIEKERSGALFKLCGTSLVQRLGREATGHHVRDLAQDIAQPLNAAVDETLTKGEPYWCESAVTLGRHCRYYAELYLPLSREERGPSIVLMASYPLRR